MLLFLRPKYFNWSCKMTKMSSAYQHDRHLPLHCTFGNLLSSSMREMMFMGLLAIMSRASWLSVNSMCCQLMSSRLYSSCSSLKTCRTKNCCRFSLAKLMQSCSKLQRRKNQWKKEGFSNDDTNRNSKKIFRCQVNEPKVTVSTRHAKNKSPVDDEVLKTKDVEQPDRPAYYVTLTGRRSVDGSIDLINNPDKQPPVDPLEEETHVSKNIELQFFYGMFTVGLGRHPY